MLLAFGFYKKLYSLEYFVFFCLCIFLLLSHSFIGADQLRFHTTLALSAIVVLSEYDGNLALSA